MNAAGMTRAMLFLVLVTAAALPAHAAPPQESGNPAAITRKHVISTNPLLDMFTWFNAEWEARIGTYATAGISGSFISIEDNDTGIDTDENFLSGNAFIRYYPTEAFKGFFFGGRFGIYNVKEKSTADEKSGTFFGAGIDVGYGWILGAQQRFAVSIGIGAVRLFGGDLEDVQTTLPTIRLINVGVAF